MERLAEKLLEELKIKWEEVMQISEKLNEMGVLEDERRR